MKNSPKPICGARNRQGKPCEKPPMKGKTRCILHGGKTPQSQNAGTANRAYAHGLYGKYLKDEERAQWDAIPLGDVDHEIRMAKVWLSRALALEADISKDPDSTSNKAGMELSEIRKSADDRGERMDLVSKRPDVSARVNWLLGRIAQLEKTRGELLAAAADKGDRTVRFVVEVPADESEDVWLKNYAARKAD